MPPENMEDYIVYMDGKPIELELTFDGIYAGYPQFLKDRKAVRDIALFFSAGEYDKDEYTEEELAALIALYNYAQQYSNHALSDLPRLSDILFDTAFVLEPQQAMGRRIIKRKLQDNQRYAIQNGLKSCIDTYKAGVPVEDIIA